MADKHWVNLARDKADPAKWKTITSGDAEPIPHDWRCGTVAYKVTFSSEAGLKNVKIRVTEDGGNIAYSGAEKDRNLNFSIQNERHPATKAEGSSKLEQWCTTTLPAAGKNIYTVEAYDPATGVVKKATADREVCRRLFYYSCVVKPVGQPDFIKPDGTVVSGKISEADIANALDAMEIYHWNNSDFRLLLCNKGNFSFDAPSGHAYSIDKERVIDEHGNVTNTTSKLSKGHEADQRVRIRKQIGAIVDLTPSHPDAGKEELAEDKIIAQANKTVTASTDAWSWLDKIASVIPRADADKLIPNYFVVAWVNTLAERITKTIIWETSPRSLQSKTGLKIIDDSTKTFTLDVGGLLWYGLDQADDLNRSWLVSAEVTFIHTDGVVGADGKPLVEVIDVTKAAINPAGAPAGELGGYTQVQLDLSHEALEGVKHRFLFVPTVGTFRIKLTLRLAEAYAAGYSMTGTNVIVISDKCLFDRNTKAQKQNILHHELGHAMGMVAQGGRDKVFGLTRSPYLTPDAPGTLYGNDHPTNAQDHCGPHCDTGMTWTPPTTDAAGNAIDGYWTGTPGCTMWGSIGIWDGGTLKSTPDAYCATCKDIVRKLDLTNIFPATLHGLR